MSQAELIAPQSVTAQSREIICHAEIDPAPASESDRNGRRASSWRGKRLRGDLPRPPVIGSVLLEGGPFSFLQFLCDGGCRLYLETLFGASGTCAATMLEELRKA